MGVGLRAYICEDEFSVVRGFLRDYPPGWANLYRFAFQPLRDHERVGLRGHSEVALVLRDVGINTWYRHPALLGLRDREEALEGHEITGRHEGEPRVEGGMSRN